ncbi:MAG TPA: hypothetical protein VFS05_16340 [Gemmatimonadaceae bacterium]|nr:hypothetical protein [Gemmatimonadaceae bacterium]
MNRHLLPNEIDLLLDGEVGFGTSPLKAHVRRCAQCRAELEEARALVRELEHLPRLSPSPLFAEQVLARVQIYVPWYVALLDSVRGWVPRSRPARALAGAAAMTVLAAVTLVSLFLVSQVDAVVSALDLALERLRGAGAGWLASTLAGAIGDQGAAALRAAGWLGLVGGALALLLAAAGAATLLRGLARSRGR